MVEILIAGNIAHPHINMITVGIMGERGCFPFLFFTREIKSGCQRKLGKMLKMSTEGVNRISSC